MCGSSSPAPPPPPPQAPPVLEQQAPKTANSYDDAKTKKRKGLSRYKIDNTATTKASTTSLGGIPKKTGAS